MGPLPSPVRGHLRVRRPSNQPEFKMVACPDPSSEAVPFLHVRFREETGVPERLGAWWPIPPLVPWPPSLVAPIEAYVCEPFPAASHQRPAVPQHTGMSASELSLPTASHFLPEPLLQARPLECRALGLYDRAGVGKVKQHQIRQPCPLPRISLAISSAPDHGTLRGSPPPHQQS